MPRIQVYLPDDLYQQVKERGLPASELLQEAVRSSVDLVEAALAEDGVALAELDPADRRWFEACRESVQSAELFDDMLTDLRASIPPPGVIP
jgi:post-segregation antitoxin (ccd killing protein)